MIEVLIPLTSFTLSEDTAVFFRKKRSDGDEREEKNVSACANYGAETHVDSTIFDVLDTNRPPDLPSKWLHPPGRLGSFSWSSVKTVGKGHPNVANTCFLNATVQALAYCTPFAEDCLNGRHASRCERHSNSQLCGFCYFERHIRHVLKSDRPNEPLARWNITLLQLMKKEIRMNQGYGGWYGAQNCAHEWLVQFLDFLIKYDLPPQLQKDFEFGRIRSADMATSYLHQLFSGCIKESKICRACNKASARYELNTCFRVPLHQTRSVTKALRATFESELLTGSNRPLCEGCGVPRDKAACRAIHRPPNVLILLLQRTEFNPSCHTVHRHSLYSSHRHVQKNSVRMEVPLSLTLDPYISEDGRRLFATCENDDNRYDFVSSVNHSGTAGFGHYWAIVRAPDGHFYKLDDEYRSHVSSSALTEQLSSAYLLFYLRRRPVPLSTLVNENLQTAPDICVPSPSPWTMDLFLDVVTRDSKPKDTNSLPLQIPSPAGAASSSTRRQEVAPVAPTLVNMEKLSTPLLPTITKSFVGEKTSVEGRQTPWNSLLYASYRRNVRRRKLIRQTLARGRQRQLDRVIVYSSILKYRHNIRPPLDSNKSRVPPILEPVSLPQEEDNEAFSDNTSEYSLTIPLTDTPSTPPPTSSNKQTKGKILTKPFTLENRLYKPHDVTSQYGSQRSAVEFWDDHETAPQSIKSTELQSKMESIQASLVPRSSRRSREDQAYDRGRQKKVKNAAVSHKCSSASFDFNEALRSASFQKHATTGPRQQRFQKKQRFKRKNRKPDDS